MTEDTSDHVRKDLTVDISIDEHEGHTRAKARLRWRDQESVGVGLARLNPADRNVDDIGDGLAVARALADLARRLMALTAQDIEAVTHHEAITRQPVTSLHWTQPAVNWTERENDSCARLDQRRPRSRLP